MSLIYIYIYDLSINTYVYIYIYMYISIYRYKIKYINIYIYIYIYAHKRISSCLLVLNNERILKLHSIILTNHWFWASIVRAGIYVYIYIYVYVCICLSLSLYIYIYIHIYMYMRVWCMIVTVQCLYKRHPRRPRWARGAPPGRLSMLFHAAIYNVLLHYSR